MRIQHLPFIGLLLSAVALGEPELPKHGVVMEVWDNVKTGKVAELLTAAAKRPANAIYIRDGIDEHGAGKDNFGARFSAWLTVPHTGEYVFYVAADDAAELLLSTTEESTDMEKVCEVKSYVPRHQFAPGRASRKIRLVKGKKYALELNYKDAANADHVALAWEGPGVKKGIIADKYFSPRMNEAQRKIWQQTAAQEARGKELLKAMSEKKADALMPWLRKLPKKDLQSLDNALQKVRAGLAAKGPEKARKELQTYAKIAAGVNATPATPIANPVAKTLLHMEEAWLKSLSHKELVKLGAHRLASSLGKIEPGAKVGRISLRLDSAGDKWREEYVSMGVYAAPGKPVKVTIPKDLASRKLVVQVGHHFAEKNKPLICMPGTTRSFELKDTTTTFITPHGGLMLLRVPREVELKKTTVVVDGALRAPRFELGKDTDADWEKLKQAPAPWGELVSEHMVLLVPSDVLRNLKNPTEVMTWWNENNRDLEDFYAYYPKVPFRMHSGYYAEEGLSYWPLQWDMKNMAYLLNIEAMRAKNSALFLHEHGHHCDFWEMELSFWAESTTNWGGYYLKNREGKAFAWKDSHEKHLQRLFNVNDKGMQEIMQEKWYKINSKGTHHWSYPVTTMMIGYAEEFGWDNVKATIKRLRDKKDPMYQWNFVQKADADQAKIDRYLIGLSEAAKRDVRPYFAHFKLFPSDGAARHLDKLKLPKWDLTYLPLQKTYHTAKNEPLRIPCGKSALLSLAQNPGIEWAATTQQGGKVSFKGGDEAVYTPKAGFTGVDVLTYELTNEYGKGGKKTIEVVVE